MHMTLDIDTLARSVPGLWGDLRSDHAGETGAVMIYRGILAATRDPEVRAFAAHHRATEQEHLDLLERLLPPSRRSVLLPIWRVAGFLTGWLPALVGRRAVFATIEAVETFVDLHYEHQIAKLSTTGEQGALREMLLVCQGDEVAHRDEAAALMGDASRGAALRLWAWVTGAGSAAAVVAARRI